MNVAPLAPAAGTLHPRAAGRRIVARRGALALAALLVAPSSARALDAHEVLRYDLFSGRPVGSAGEMTAAVGADGHVLLAWTAWDPARQREAVRVQWLDPDGTPRGDSFEAVRQAFPIAVAVRPDRRALVISSSSQPGVGGVLTAVDASGVVRRGKTAAFGCELPVAVTATETGYFLACFETLPARYVGWWLSETGRARQEVEIGPGFAVALAGGLGKGVLALYQGEDNRLLARWLTPWKQGPVVELDGRSAWPLEASIEHLGDRVFAVSWLREYERSADSEDARRVTAVHAATFRAPDRVRSSPRFSGLTESFEAATGEQRRPQVLRNAATEQVVAWFRCAYNSSPGGLLCFERDGLFLRSRVGDRPAGKILELADVAAGSAVVFTGERLLTASLLRRADDRWDLEVRGFVLE
jgi:hypothetical protein